MSISAIPAPSRNIEERTTSSAPSAGLVSTDGPVCQLLAYAAAPTIRQLATLGRTSCQRSSRSRVRARLVLFHEGSRTYPYSVLRCVRELAAQEQSEAAREREKMDRAAMSGLKGDATKPRSSAKRLVRGSKRRHRQEICCSGKTRSEFYSAAARLKMMASIVSSNGDSAADQETKDDLNRGGGVLKLACAEALRWLNQAAAAHEPNAESALASGYLWV